MKKNIKCSHCNQVFQHPEEKRTDVNISVEMMGDCAFNEADILVLVSADSDLVPPLEFIKTKYPQKKLRIYFPPQRSSYDLAATVNKKVVYLEHNRKKFETAILPENVNLSDGSVIPIPPEWIVSGFIFTASLQKVQWKKPAGAAH